MHFRDLQGGRDSRSLWAAFLVLLALTGCRRQDLPPEPPPPEGALCTSIPHQSGARSLFHALACYRQIAAWGGWLTLQPAEPLQPGSRSETVETLKVRLRAEGYLPALRPGEAESYDYDPAVTAAVVRFQRRHGLEATGSVDAETLAELNVPAAGRVRQIELNLERCRRQPEAQNLELTAWVDPDGKVHFRSDPFLEKAEGEEQPPAESRGPSSGGSRGEAVPVAYPDLSGGQGIRKEAFVPGEIRLGLRPGVSVVLRIL